MEASTSNAPALSVVVVASGAFGTIRRTAQHLHAQTARDRLEVVIIAPSADGLALRERETRMLEDFASYQVIEVGAIPSIDRARAPGIHRAQAPIVALVEDHAYPAPGWAEALLGAYQEGPWGAVGTAVANANPQTARSWATFLLSYGTWADGVEGGEVEDLPGHNVSYRRDLLTAYGDALADMLERESGLHDELKADGHRLYLIPDEKIYHVNPSLVSSMTELFFGMGRLYGAKRARENAWAALQRAAYVGGAPLIPFVRLARTDTAPLGPAWRERLGGRLTPALLLALAADAAGQAVGYAAGPGEGTLRKLDNFEVDRMRHITAQERQALPTPRHAPV